MLRYPVTIFQVEDLEQNLLFSYIALVNELNVYGTTGTRHIDDCSIVCNLVENNLLTGGRMLVLIFHSTRKQKKKKKHFRNANVLFTPLEQHSNMDAIQKQV